MSTTTPGRVRNDARTVEVYDFRRPTTLVREHSRILEMALESFARQWGTQLTAKVRVVSQVTLAAVAMKTYDDYVRGLPVTTTMAVCEIENIPPRAVIQLPTADALNWIAHMLGAGGAIAEVDRKFTDVERALITSVLEETIRDLRHSLGRLLSGKMQISSIQHNSQFVQAAPTAELMIVADFDMRVGERSCRGSVAVPASAVLPQIGQPSLAPSKDDSRTKVRQHVSQSQLEVQVQFAEAAIRPGKVIGLTVGDVIALPHHESRPLDVLVDGHVMARATIGESGSRLACRIVTTTEEKHR